MFDTYNTPSFRASHAPVLRGIRRSSRPRWVLPAIPAGVLIRVALGVFLLEPCDAVADSPADRFVNSLQDHPAIPQEARTLIRTTWESCRDCDGGEFLTQGLAVLSDRFRDGLDAYDSDDYDRCARIMHDLRTDADPFVAVNAAAYEIKALVALERLEQAGRLIADLTAAGASRVKAYSYFAPEIDFLHGYCLLADLQYEAAANALQQFLKTYADAVPRLTLTAEQILSELATRTPGGLGDVVDLMGYSRRKLTIGVTDATTQQRQQQAVALLDQLIEEAEDRESKSAGGGGSGGASGAQLPNNPMSQSQLPQGTVQEGPLREPRRANPGEVWGSMPPAQREQVLQAIRDCFPSRYRQLVEQYYEQLAKKR
ncbi:MAG: hypothetical protein ACE5HE_00750 [Phycisphaerae bacterium]